MKICLQCSYVFVSFQAITEASQVNFRKSRVISFPDEQGTVFVYFYSVFAKCMSVLFTGCHTWGGIQLTMKLSFLPLRTALFG